MALWRNRKVKLPQGPSDPFRDLFANPPPSPPGFSGVSFSDPLEEGFFGAAAHIQSTTRHGFGSEKIPMSHGVDASNRISLRSSMASGYKGQQGLGGGSIAQSVQKVAFNDKTFGVLKTAEDSVRENFNISAIEQTQNEYLTAKMGQAIGARVPEVEMISPTQVMMRHVHGVSGSEALMDTGMGGKYGETLEHIKGPQGQGLALLDVLTNNYDRHSGNWIANEEGITGIDHGLARFGNNVTQPKMWEMNDHHFGRLKGEATSSAKYFGSYGRTSFVKEDLMGLEPKLEALRPEFNKFNRGHDLDYAKGMLGHLVAHVSEADEKYHREIHGLPAAREVVTSAKRVVSSARHGLRPKSMSAMGGIAHLLEDI